MNASAVGAFRAPLYIAWELTHLCNANCIHCYSASGPRASRSGELTTEEALGVIEQLAESGLLVLAFSGGEPLLREDWRALVERAVLRGLLVNVGSNGSSITERIATELHELGVSSVTISIDSHDPRVHDTFRQLDGLHAAALRAVRRLSKAGVRVVVGFTPTRLNYQDGPAVIRQAIEAGAAAVNLSQYVPAGRGRTDLALDPNTLRDVLKTWIDLREEYAPTHQTEQDAAAETPSRLGIRSTIRQIVRAGLRGTWGTRPRRGAFRHESLNAQLSGARAIPGVRPTGRREIEIIWHDCRVGLLVAEEERRNYVGCGAGRLVARILPDGTVTPCVFLPTSIGSLRDHSFSELWADSLLLRAFRTRAAVTGNCGSCEHLNTCGGCRAVAYAWSQGNAFAGDPHCWVEPMAGVQLPGLVEGECLPV